MWIIWPLVLGLVFVVLPCYTLGQLGMERTWCGYKGAPPYTGPQFFTGLAVGLATAVLFSRRKAGVK